MQRVALALLALLLGISVPQLCEAHGKLTKPTPRDGISIGRAGLDQNNPVSFEPGCTKENTCDAFVCREAAPNPNVRVTDIVAGQSLELGWMFTALHVGDCSVYISYDVDKPRSRQKFVKIANIPDCKSYSAWNIKIPAILPAGRAILRWDWVALHVWPKTELFVQCVDMNIQSASSTKPSDLDSFSITNPPIYPDDGNDGVGYRNAFGSGAQEMTGPSCIDGSINECSLTAPGMPRNSDSRRSDSGAIVPAPQPQPAPVPQLPKPVPAPQQPMPAPEQQPVPVPAPSPSGDCVSSGPEYYTAACAALVLSCEMHSFCKRIPARGTPAMAPPKGACVSNDATIDYSVACKALEATCEQFNFCKRVSSLTQSSAKHSAPGRRLRRLRVSTPNVLIQRGSEMQRGTFPDNELTDGIQNKDDQVDSVFPQVASTYRSEL